jgi:Domain of unknown function (DUF4340)
MGKSRIAATLVLLAFAGLGFYLWASKEVPARSAAASGATLPDVALSASDARRVSKIQLTRPDDDDKSQIHTIILEKIGQDWEVTAPVKTRASASKVNALLDNLQSLALVEVLAPADGSDDAYDLTDAKALHVVAWDGKEKVSDLYFGKTNTRGQLAKTAGVNGVLVIGNAGAQGYSGFLYTRGLRGWRETSIFQFHADDVTAVEITNAHGFFAFSREGGAWTGSFTPRDKSGRLGTPAGEWKGFDGSKVDDLLRAFASLSADDFGAEEDRADSGVDQAERTGGVVDIKVADGKGDRILRVGSLTRSTTRWAIKDSRWAIPVGGDGTLYAVSPWRGGWATDDASRFEASAGGSDAGTVHDGGR